MSIYDLINSIRERPSMFVRDKSLSEIETYLDGYVACLEAHGIEESDGGRPFHPRTFAIWLHETLGWSGSCGFAHAIKEHTSSGAEAFDRFFELVTTYRALPAGGGGLSRFGRE